MALVIESIQHVGVGAWLYTWSGVAPFDVLWRGAYELEAVEDTELLIEWEDDEEPPALEIRDSESTGVAENLRWSPVGILQWRGVVGCAYYDVEEYTGGEWVVLGPSVAEELRGYYEFEVDLVDGTTHTYRVSAVDGLGNVSAYVGYELVGCSNPAEPSVTVEWDDGAGEIVVSARA